MKSGQGNVLKPADFSLPDCPEKTGSCADFPEAFSSQIHGYGIPEVFCSSRRPESGHKKAVGNPVDYAGIEAISSLFSDFAWHFPVPVSVQVGFTRDEKYPITGYFILRPYPVFVSLPEIALPLFFPFFS